MYTRHKTSDTITLFLSLDIKFVIILKDRLKSLIKYMYISTFYTTHYSYSPQLSSRFTIYYNIMNCNACTGRQNIYTACSVSR